MPGRIQPHGILIATAPHGRRVTHVSANLAVSTGLPAERQLDVDLDRVIGAAAFAAIERGLPEPSDRLSRILTADLPFPFRPRRRIIVHRWMARTIVEVKDATPLPDADDAFAATYTAVEALERPGTVAELCDELARQIRCLTKYDRVMVYRFDDDGNGTVVAEDRKPGLVPYLQLRFPASDIPAQARRLYALQRVHYIPDATYRPVDVLSSDGMPLDMSLCTLRGISPMHVEYLANMGVRASFSISLVTDDGLWGLICCHHQAPLYLGPELRRACDMIGKFASALLLKVAMAERLSTRLRRLAQVRSICDGIGPESSILESLTSRRSELLELMDATGAFLRFGGEVRTVGATPPADSAAALVDQLLLRSPDKIAHLSNAGLKGGPAEKFVATASGILALPLANGDGDAIAWFRPEVPRTVGWGGNPNKAAISDGTCPSPRKSFAAWIELLRGRSEPWTEECLLAADDFTRGMTSALLRRAERQLAYMSAFDALTGLPNRRTIESELRRWQSKGEPQAAALLFIDLDRFKSINDTLGHKAGDDCLVELARRVQHLAPPGSVAGRLGGDEFLLFWPGASPAEAETLAQALVRACAQPLVLEGRVYHAGASIGLAHADAGDIGALMRHADTAMYTAKKKGGGQAVSFQGDLHTALPVGM